MTIRVRLLGGFEARLPGGQLAELGTRKCEALLAFLACHPGESHSRDRLAAMFWGNGSDRAARQSLRQALASLRRTFATASPLLRTDRDSVTLDGDAVDVDVVAFEAAAQQSTPALAAAAQLYRGPLLDGFALREELFEDWLARERARLHDRAVALLLRLSELADRETAASALLRALELDPLCEEAHRRLIRAYIDSASFNAAIRQYNACADVLRRELDATPEPQTTALHREAVAARAADVPPHPEAPIESPSGERKQVTVLCAALLPASPAGGLGDPEETQEALGPVLRELRAIAQRNGGHVIGEAGDELLAVFGAPIALESHAANACRAASDMTAVVRDRPNFAFRASIAIDSGDVVIRTRDQSMLPAGVFGHCLRRAARLARSGWTLAIGTTEATFSLANRFWRFAPVAAASLDAGASPIALYAPIGPWPGASGLDHFPAHLLSRFIGRREEIAAITAALEAAGNGRGQMIAVVGEPGIGKSRLFHEFIRSVPHEWRVVACRGDPQLAVAPYRPIAKAIAACLGIVADGQAELSRDEFVRAALALDPSLEPLLPALASLLELETPEPIWDALEPAQKGHQIMDAAAMVFALSAKRQPLLLVVEDLHWLDPASRTVLERVIEVLPAARMLLMVNYRPEFVHGWGGRSFYRQIAVGPLSAATTAEFVDALLGDDVSMQSLRGRLVASTGGNPFFIEECIRSLTLSGKIAGRRGAFRAEQELETLALPETVQAVLAARIDQLSAPDRALLRVAAVIGNEVPYGLLFAVSDLAEDALHAALARLQASEFIVETALSSSPSYRFKHALTNEVAYTTLLQQTRRELHARILAALEGQHAGRLDEHLEALAYHSSRGDVLEEAAEYGRRAGFKAAARAANRAAVAHFGQALLALGRLPETPDRMTEEIDLRFETRNALFVLGEHHLVMDHLRRAEALAQRTNDSLRRGYAALHIGGWFWQQGQQQSSRDASERAFAIARDIDSSELTALAWYRIGLSRHASGEYHLAIEALLRSTRMLEQAGRTELVGFGGYPYAFCCSFLSWSFAERGAFALAREWGLRGWHFAIEHNHTYTQSIATFGLSLCYIREGSLDEARAMLEKGLDLYRVGEVPVSFSWVASPLGFTYVAQGQHERGFELLRRALTVDQPHLHRAQLELWLADACLVTGRGDEVRAAGERGLLLAREDGEQANVAWAERILGDFASTFDGSAAHRHYERAIDIARVLELQPHLIAALFGRSRLLRTEGHVALADALWQEATSLAATSHATARVITSPAIH